jgi:hypothetical protein
VTHAGENSHTRQFSGQWADQLRPSHRDDLRGLRHSKLGVSFGHNLRGLSTGDQDRLVLNWSAIPRRLSTLAK